MDGSNVAVTVCCGDGNGDFDDGSISEGAGGYCTGLLERGLGGVWEDGVILVGAALRSVDGSPTVIGLSGRAGAFGGIVHAASPAAAAGGIVHVGCLGPASDGGLPGSKWGGSGG
jgi:hypothetical protein